MSVLTPSASRFVRTWPMSSQSAGTLLICLRVRPCTVSMSRSKPSKKSNHSISTALNPTRVLTLNGNRPFRPSCVAWMIAPASGQLSRRIRAAQAPLRTSLLAGQPIFKSTPAKFTPGGRPSSRASSPEAICPATARKLSGSSPQSCATTLPSFSAKRSFLSKFGRPALISPSTLTNSVKNTSGGATSATTCRNTVSVTSSIGANAKKGLGKSSSILLLGSAIERF